MDIHQDHVETFVEIFSNDQVAQEAVRELKAAGFTESQIEVVSRDEITLEPSLTDERNEVEEGATAGAAAGLSIGALWGLGVLAGIAPDIGSSLATGTLGVLLSSAATGVATVGAAGALIGLGVHERHETNRSQSRRTIVTVRTRDRADVASFVLKRFCPAKRSSQAL